MPTSNMPCGCDVQPLSPATALADTMDTEAQLVVRGMGCGHCATRVQNALVSTDGVGAAYVTLQPPIARVLYDPERTNVDGLLAAIARAGKDSHHSYQGVPLT